MHVRVAGLALPVVIGVGVAVTSCSTPGTVKPAVSATGAASAAAVSGSPTASPAAPSSPGSVPVGYTRVGGVAQGISIAAPASWVAVDLAKENPESAVSKADPSGVSHSTLLQEMESLQKVHGIIVYDVKSAVDSHQHSARTLQAYCDAPGTTDVGAAGVPLLKASAAADLEKLGAKHITVKDLKVGGVPGVEISYQLSSSGEGTIYGSQLEVLPKPGKACDVAVTVGEGQSAGNVLSVAAATAQFP